MPIKKNTRTFSIKQNTGYSIPSKGMICEWKIIPSSPEEEEMIKDNPPKLCLDDYPINIPFKNPLIISLQEMREYIRDIYYPEDSDQNTLLSLETMFCGFQLQAVEFYSDLSTDDRFKCLFTRDFKKVSLDFGNFKPESLNIEEIYWDRSADQIPDKMEDEDDDENAEIIKEISEAYSNKVKMDLQNPTR